MSLCGWTRLAVFLKWVLFAAMIGFGDGHAQASDNGVDEYPIDEGDRNHWAFERLVKPELPRIEQTSWPRTGIDYFVLQRLEQAGITPAPPAERATLLRRVKFDLIGLPPTLDELDQFLSDTAPDAYERLVGRLLASHGYGERWAQHWLDLARFAETDGFEHDKVRKGAWQYRQWVIDALNDDLPYDQFVRLQIAGDLIDAASGTVATMFCMAGPDMPDLNEQELRRHDKLNEVTSTVGAVLLGLQMHCAQCHDHKYDPISQADFYRLRAIFESGVPTLRRDQHVLALTATENAAAPRIYFRGELQRAGPEVEPLPPRIAFLDGDYESFDARAPRLAFANWLFRDDNPLTARVIANRLWQHHFGKSLAENPNDFGVIAGGPLNPELLDWLAVELREGGWSMKRIHRSIVLSATYRQSSYVQSGDEMASETFERNIARDPDLELLSRFPRRRLEGEIIRDSLLAVSGGLDLAYGGPSVMPDLPPELIDTLLKKQWEASEFAGDHWRRSIYVFARRNLRYPVFEAFDRPDAGASCGRRDTSTTAIQSLLMLNSDLSFVAAEKLRDRLLCDSQSVPDDAKASAWVERLFLVALSRQPSPQELNRFTEFLVSQGTDPSESLFTVCLAVINSNEFLYID